jgi:hypothetical protein
VGREFGEGLRVVGLRKREEDGGREGARWRKKVAVGGCGGSRWREERREKKDWGRGHQRRGRIKWFFFFGLGGGMQVRLRGGDKGQIKILRVTGPH